MIQENVIFESLLNPGLVIIRGITYVIPGWHEVPTGTTLEEVHAHWKLPDIYKVKRIENKTIEDTVVSKRSGETYSVRLNNGYWTCTCVGFGFRRKCKHIEEIKAKYNIE